MNEKVKRNLKQITKNMKEQREKEGLSFQDLADKTGMSRSTLQRYETGGIKNIPLDKLEILAKGLNCSPEWLLGWNGSYKKEKPIASSGAVQIPVLGNVAAGIPIEMVEDILDWEEIPSSWGTKDDFFCLQLKGDSMLPRMAEGDVVVVRKQADAETGDIVIFTINGDAASCKRLRKTDTGLMFIPFNNNYDPMVFTWNQVESLPIHILGKVIELRAKFK